MSTERRISQERQRYQLMLLAREFEPPTAIVATIGERAVTRDQLHRAAGYAEQSLRLEYFHAVEREFRAFADRALLAREAARRGGSVDALLRQRYAALGKLKCVLKKPVIGGHSQVHTRGGHG